MYLRLNFFKIIFDKLFNKWNLAEWSKLWSWNHHILFKIWNSKFLINKSQLKRWDPTSKFVIEIFMTYDVYDRLKEILIKNQI